MADIDVTLSQRGANYGSFTRQACLAQLLKESMREHPDWVTLPPDMKEALEMVMHKISRIINGNPEFHDSWHDIIGYVRLIEKTLTPTEEGTTK